MISTIVAVDQNWAIGKDGSMLFHLPADLAYFKKITSGKTVFMGRKTLESLPNAKPLPNRRNIVLSRDKNFLVDGAEVVSSFEDLFKLIANEQSDVFNIGGGRIYADLIDYCSTAYVTKINSSSQAADSFFPNLDNRDGWVLKSSSDHIEEDGVTFSFCVYDNLDPKPYK